MEEIAFPGRFLDYRVLVVPNVELGRAVAFSGNIFDIQLPLYTELLGGLIGFWDIWLLFLGGSVIKAQSFQQTIQRDIMTFVPAGPFQLTVQFDQSDVVVAMDKPEDGLDFLFGVGLGMWGVRPLGAVLKRSFGPVVATVPSGKACFRDFVLPADVIRRRSVSKHLDGSDTILQ